MAYPGEASRSWPRGLRAPRLPFARRPWLVVRPRQGLANRMLGLASAMAAARLLRLRLAVYWVPGEGFSEEGFAELFANDLDLCDDSRYEAALGGGAPIGSQWFGVADEPPGPHFDAVRALREIRRRGLVFDEAWEPLEALLARRGVAEAPGLARHTRRCLRELRPAPAIECRVAAFAGSRFAGRPVLGVHIRRGDALVCRRSALFRSSRDEDFAAAIEARLSQDPSLLVFLATDCEATQEAFAGRFGERLCFADKDFVPSEWRAPKDGQASALVDLLLLARTRSVLGTRGSTFGSLAALLGRVPYRSVGEAPPWNSASLSR